MTPKCHTAGLLIRVISIPIFCAFILFPVYLTSCSKDHVGKGKDFLKVKMYQEALKEFNLEIQKNPANADAWFYKGIAELRVALSEEELSSDAFEKAIAQHPNIFESFENTLNLKPHYDTGEYAYFLGKIFYKRDKHQKAALEFEKYENFKDAIPSYKEEAIYLAGSSYKKLKDYKSAKNAYSTFINKYPSGKFIKDACLGLGESALQLGEVDNAISIFEKLSAEEGHIRKGAQYFLGQCYERTNQKEKAIQEYIALALTDDINQTEDTYPYEAYKRLIDLNEFIPLKGISHYPHLFKDKELWVKGIVRPINKEEFSDAAWDLFFSVVSSENHHYRIADNSLENGITLVSKEAFNPNSSEYISLQVKVVSYFNKFVYLKKM